MYAKAATVVLFVVFVTQAESGCICGFGEGRDMCSGPKCSPMVVRPAPLPRLKLEDLSKPRVVCKQIGGLPALKAVGDLCSCRQSIVVPALVPRPSCPCNTCGKATSSSSSSMSSSGSSSGSSSFAFGGASSMAYQNAGGSYGGGNVAEVISSQPIAIVDPQGSAYEVAADPVSLSLAYKMQNKACGGVREDFNFGFRKLPVDGSKAQIIKNVPEENLYKLNGQIVELKPVSCSNSKMSVDEEAMEELAGEELADTGFEGADERSGVKKLSYGEIGFGLAKVKSPSFVALEGIAEANPQPIVSTNNLECNDGFVPGKMVINNIPRREVYVPGPGGPSDCEDSEELGIPARFVSSFSSSSSSSSSSSKSHHHHHAASSSCMGGC